MTRWWYAAALSKAGLDAEALMTRAEDPGSQTGADGQHPGRLRRAELLRHPHLRGGWRTLLWQRPVAGRGRGDRQPKAALGLSAAHPMNAHERGFMSMATAKVDRGGSSCAGAHIVAARRQAKALLPRRERGIGPATRSCPTSRRPISGRSQRQRRRYRSSPRAPAARLDLPRQAEDRLGGGGGGGAEGTRVWVGGNRWLWRPIGRAGRQIHGRKHHPGSDAPIEAALVRGRWGEGGRGGRETRRRDTIQEAWQRNRGEEGGGGREGRPSGMRTRARHTATTITDHCRQLLPTGNPPIEDPRGRPSISIEVQGSCPSPL